MCNQAEKEELINQIKRLHDKYLDNAKPFMDRLTTLIALEPSPPLTVDFLNNIPEGVKNAFADAVATGTGIYYTCKPGRGIPGGSACTPPAASGQQEDLSAAILRIPCTAPDDIKGKGIFVYYYENGLRDGLRKAAELAAAHPAPAQQESEPIGYVRQSELDSYASPAVAGRAMMLHKDGGAGKVALYTRAPAPAALTDEQIDFIARQYFAEAGSQQHCKDAIHDAFLTASAAPAELAMPWLPIDSAPNGGCLIDILMPNGKRWCGVHYDRICNEWRLITECGKLLRVKRDYPTHWMPIPPAPDAAIASQQKGGHEKL